MRSTCCNHNPEDLRDTRYRRVLWAVLVINSAMFLIEVVAGLASRSASLQADALDFLADAANYGISLFVIGMALRYPSSAALAKGVTMGLFGLWVLVTSFWHVVYGTVPEALTMGAVGVAALLANAASFALLWAYRSGDSNMRSVWAVFAKRCHRQFCGAARGFGRVQRRARLARHLRCNRHGWFRAARRLASHPTCAGRAATSARSLRPCLPPLLSTHAKFFHQTM
jgi:hypothetical protein